MLTETTARMKALGVSTQAGAQQFDNMIQGMGMTTNMANEASLELVNLGDQIGVAAEVISNDFNKAATELAKYGPDAIDVFKGMAAAAKSTGIEVGNLNVITKQFDTFEGAAQSAGKLNAILGGGVVNSMDLLNATEEERVRLLIQSMSLSGKNFESLNRFEKQAIASAAGIQDMTEANKLFSMSLSAYDDMQASASGASAEAAKLQERAQAATTFAQKLRTNWTSIRCRIFASFRICSWICKYYLRIERYDRRHIYSCNVSTCGSSCNVRKSTTDSEYSMALASSLKAKITNSALAAIETVYGNAVAFTSLVQEGANLRERAAIALDLLSVPAKTSKELQPLNQVSPHKVPQQ